MAAGPNRPVLELLIGAALVVAFIGVGFGVYTGDLPVGDWWAAYGPRGAGRVFDPLAQRWNQLTYGMSTIELVLYVGGPPAALFVMLMMRQRNP